MAKSGNKKDNINKEELKEKELSLDELQNVAGGSLKDTVRTNTEDITDSIKKRI